MRGSEREGGGVESKGQRKMGKTERGDGREKGGRKSEKERER